MTTTAERFRTKISITIDPALLHEVDSYIAAHPGMDRSKTIDAALLRWYGEQQEAAIAAQHQAPISEDDQREQDEWRAIRRAAAARMVRRFYYFDVGSTTTSR